MEQTLPLEERSIYQIYCDGSETQIYKIPIYQRNYAWEEDQISALVKDVYDSFKKDAKDIYYIGTLVTYKRGDNEFEVIDGQQRLTTIYLILKALGIGLIKNKLTYTARKISADTIKNIPKVGEYVDNGIINGFDYAKKAIKDNLNDSEIKSFEKYFLHNVHIIHYSVPKDVNLNHYFEVMNSRGEQLEKHEIVKSILSQKLRGDDLAKFSRIWEACSNMNVYIQQSFDERVFKNSLKDLSINSFDDIPSQDASAGKDSIWGLIHKPIQSLADDEESSQNDTFQPIIDFPNFLLIVLKVTLAKNGKDFDPTDFALDDKELLNEFNKAIKNKPEQSEFAKQFAFNLLKAKYFLDNYVVHHVNTEKEILGDNPWKLQYYYQERKNKRYPKNLAYSETQKELVHLLSMFEVAFTARQRKNYLFYCLMQLFDNENIPDYLKFLQKLADKFFFDVYLNKSLLNERNQPGPNAFDSVILRDGKLCLEMDKDCDYASIFANVYHQGSPNIPLFVFNFTDYKLWKLYADTLRGNKSKKGSTYRNYFFNELGCGDFGLETFDNFYFSRTRKSLEHYYPQAKAVDEVKASDASLSHTQINCFGNFAMIGADANSSGSNWDPKQKLDHYCDTKSNQVSVASLKFKIMMQMCQDNHKAIISEKLIRPRFMEWNFADILEHQNKMMNIILKYSH